MRSSHIAPKNGQKGPSRFEKLATYAADHGWLIAKVVFVIHYILWLGLTYFPILWVFNFDTNVYRTAAYQIAQKQQIYWLNVAWPNQNPYYYSPQFAWLCSLLNSVDNRTFNFLFGIGLLAIPFVLSLNAWRNLSNDLDLDTRVFYRWLPLVLLATSTLYNFIAGNIVILLTGLLGVGLFCIFRKKSLIAAVIVVVMILTKPHFAAPLLVVLLFGLPEAASRRFVFRTALYAISLYIAVTAVFLLSVGPTYGLRLMLDQVLFLLQGITRYPYVTADVFFTVNHSFDQQFYRLGLGNFAWIATLIKLLFSGYLLWLLYRSFKAGVRLTTHAQYLVVLALMAYLVIFSFTWELMDLLFGPIMLAFLLSLRDETTQLKRGRWLLLLLFVWELIIPAVYVIPTTLIQLLILFWVGNQFINNRLRHPDLLLAHSGVQGAS